jgi:radical SAM protein with 4Fe4S-binding SPASM domain
LDSRLAEHAAARGILYGSSIPVALTSVTRIMRTCALQQRCNITSTLGILPDGTISVCGMGRYLRDFQFGKLGESNLSEIWLTHPTLQLIRQGIPGRLRGICGRCVARSTCLGCCRLENEYTSLETLFDPFPTCAEMEERGLFPKSRMVARIPATAVPSGE